jgi:AcrR family transcriptional regulator
MTALIVQRIDAPVKTRKVAAMTQAARRYVSEVRDDQAQRTRRAVVTAARELFLARGYAATTIDAIAEAAKVSRRTVFTSVGGKAVLLRLALDWAIVGDDEPVAMAERPAIQAIVAERDPRRGVEMFAAVLADVFARVAPLDGVLTAAADADPAAAQFIDEAIQGRMFGAREFVGYLASLDALADGLTEQRAADLCWSIMDGHMYKLLVIERGWSPEEFTRWLTATFTASLLRP